MKPGQPMPEKWRLFFKFFCYLNPQNVPIDSIESVFLYEQVRCYVNCDVYVDSAL